MARKQENVEYTRFSPAQRFEHILVIVSFTCLALTGIPQKYATHDWAQAMIDFLGGIESVRIVHRVMATVLMAESIYHGGVLSYKVFVLGERLTMMPTLRDLKNVWDWVRFNLGRVKQHPRMPRFNFGEKAEYLAMVWGDDHHRLHALESHRRDKGAARSLDSCRSCGAWSRGRPRRCVDHHLAHVQCSFQALQ